MKSAFQATLYIDTIALDMAEVSPSTVSNHYNRASSVTLNVHWKLCQLKHIYPTAMSIKAYLSNTVCCVYRPLSSNASWIHSFYAYISQLTLVTSSCVIISDLNYDLLKSSAISDELAASFDLKQLICSPTRITTTSATLINYIYTYNVKAHISGLTELHIADHLAKFCVIDAYKDKASQRHLVMQFRSFKGLDATALVNDLQSLKLSVDSVQISTNNIANHFQSQFTDIWNQHAPLVKRKIRHKATPRINQDILSSIHHRNAAYKKFLCNRSTDDYMKYKQH